MIVFSGAKRLYGDVVNSAVYLALGVIGFAIWNKKDPRDIRACGAKERVVCCLVTAAATFLVFLLTKRTDDPLPLLDSFTTVSSFVATYYMMTKKIDTWIVWFVNDIFYAIEYFIVPGQALGLFVLNLVWTGMAVLSYRQWKKIMNG